MTIKEPRARPGLTREAKLEKELRRTQNRRMNVHAGGQLYGVPTTESDPGEVLLNEIRRTSGHIEWLRERINESDPAMFVKSLWLVKRASGWVAPSEIDTTDWSAAGALWIDIYQKERAHLAQICRTALAAGIEERRIRLAERMAEKISDAIRGMLYDLNLDPEDDRVRTIVFKWLSQAQGLDVGPGKMSIEG